MPWLCEVTGGGREGGRSHHRCGHLFQNRYKSLVVDEEPYFLELIRYIHLNPLRAGLVHTMDELDRWPLSGHAVLMGRMKAPFQDTVAVLSRFSPGAGSARRLYRHFVEERHLQGTREDLQGGGLIRSLGGTGAAIAHKAKGLPQQTSDDRVLGLGIFVEEVVAQSGEHPTPVRQSIETIMEETARRWHLKPADLAGPSRKRCVTRARREMLVRGRREAGLTLAELARLCHITPAAVSKHLDRDTGLQVPTSSDPNMKG